MLCQKIREMASSWQIGSENRSGNFPKSTITVSEILGQKCFNAAVFCTIEACTKRELTAVIFRTGGRPIQRQKQFQDFKEGQFLKTASYFSGQINCKSFSCFLVRILTKQNPPTLKEFLRKTALQM